MGVRYGKGNPAYVALHKLIKEKYRRDERKDLVPTFEEFVRFVVSFH